MGRKVIYAFLNCLHCDREGIVKHKFDNSHVPGVRNLPQAVWKFYKTGRNEHCTSERL